MTLRDCKGAVMGALDQSLPPAALSRAERETLAADLGQRLLHLIEREVALSQLRRLAE